ncbi:DUF4445 domain-containing protein [Alkalibaculum sp. M08DMB]|uniref:DUF4445 domain-containing protein n=1 Tax=Alkalibaculum sporogenes TaxID=2655001 RepID=A0A6A7KBQ6_9FIRM|nr:corrinoid activation/regeneration protein AcsV [Alkalibaculum sporogenes]MPW26617.1 DUF4445 domain-containing protein [Alkalibaculum sporogenes]
MKVIINTPDNRKVIDVSSGENLIDIIRSAGINIDAPCNGFGTCGKCKVKLVNGKVKEKKNSHKLSNQNKDSKYILACSSTIIEPVEIDVPKESILDVTNIKIEKNNTEHYEKYYNIKKTFESKHSTKKHLEILELQLDIPNIDDNISDVTRIKKFITRELKNKNIEIGIALLRKIPSVLRENEFKIAIIYTVDKGIIKLLDIRSQGNLNIYGVAIDIGTTSVSACLVNLKDDSILSEVSCANAQSKYGADVINRIIYSTKGNGLNKLKEAMVSESINPLIIELCLLNSISKDDILIFTASANTTMSHLLLEVYADYLRKEPYIPVFADTKDIAVTSEDMGLNINKNAIVIISPSVASYVGGDISAGVIASDMRESEKNTILIDLGTNGEIVFGNKDFLMTCACSAGPAFEGGEISCGMRAAHGAIEAVTIDQLSYIPNLDIIGSYRPYGICGSGIIDLISELKRVNLIDPKGKFRKDSHSNRVKFDEYGIGYFIVAFKKEYGTDEDICITEIDIDNFIRAKAAVYSATYVLLSSLGLDFDQVDEIKVAGGIGSHINIKSAINIGLFPDIDVEKYHFIGNSSLTGSYMSLINKNAKDYIDNTAENMTYLELSVYPGYMDEFISASFIPHTNIKRFPSHK